MERAMRILLAAGVLLVILLFTAIAQPLNPSSLTEVTSSRRSASSAASVPAQAGNVTELRINVSVITQGWQGYYGSVEGEIVLDDAQNASFYSWNIASPSGEIFATRNATTPDWSAGNIICADITHLENEESALNFNLDGDQDVDGINETFTLTTHPPFNLSNGGFEEDQCNFTVSTYVDGGPGARNFNETILYANASTDNFTIYMAYLNDDALGFNGTNWDFQMLVPEDGHSGDTATTTYYFYVELD